MSDMSEDDLIATFFAPLAGEAGLGLADDAARLALSEGHELIVTTDAVVAGVHFFADDTPENIARKALRVNLSDLAAKGARPLGFLLTLGLPLGWKREWLQAFARALGEDARAFHCPLVGGDTVQTPGPLTIAITALGETPRGGMTRRTTARVGDIIVVTGTIGDAALGLEVRRATVAEAGEAGAQVKPAWIDAIGAGHATTLLQRYLQPQPRNALAEAVRGLASCGMDISDGLVGDLRKMTRASGVSARVTLDDVPLSPAAAAALASDDSLARQIFGGGDDYELLLTVSPDRFDELARAAQRAGCGVTAIGEVLPVGAHFDVRWRDAPADMGTGSYTHF